MSFKNINQSIQTFGRTLLLPIGVLAPIGMILGISGALTQDYMVEKIPFLGNEIVNDILESILTISNVIFDNIPLLFALGVAYGMSKKDKGIAVFASVTGYLCLIVSMNVYLVLTGTIADADVMTQKGQIEVLGIQTVNISAAGGIITGLVAARATDKFYYLELPDALAFFSGKKSVPIITIFEMGVIGLFIPFIWNYLVSILTNLSSVITSVMGPFFTAAGERLFIPFGLHHVWNALFRFTEAGGTYEIDGEKYVGVFPAITEVLFNQGPNSKYWEMMPELSRFMAQQQMLVVLFIFPAIALAIYKTSYKNNKKYVKSMMVTMVLTAFLGNVTEPLEFTFAFIAPPLFIVYAVIVGLGALTLSLFSVSIGYIRGTIFDFVIFGVLYENSNWIYLVLVGLVYGVITYFIFYIAITKFDIKTPGRETVGSSNNSSLLKEKKYGDIAELVIDGLGGKRNIKNVDNCITRLRIDLGDSNLVQEDIINDTGCMGITYPNENHIHIVYGPKVEVVRNTLEQKMEEN